jgi:hypothetical protein
MYDKTDKKLSIKYKSSHLKNCNSKLINQDVVQLANFFEISSKHLQEKTK